jgi:hypothetical protein
MGFRQLEPNEIKRPLEPIAYAPAALRERLEKLGLQFAEDHDPGLPSPSQAAAIELDNSSQFAFEHFYSYGERLVGIRARPGALSPAEKLRELQDALGLHDIPVAHVEPKW